MTVSPRVFFLVLFLSLHLSLLFVSTIFSVKQEVLPDRKRVTTRSYLPITPVDTDSGSNFTCVASNLAVPMGKRVTVTLNVHRTLLRFAVRLLRRRGEQISWETRQHFFCLRYIVAQSLINIVLISITCRFCFNSKFKANYLTRAEQQFNFPPHEGSNYFLLL